MRPGAAPVLLGPSGFGLLLERETAPCSPPGAVFRREARGPRPIEQEQHVGSGVVSPDCPFPSQWRETLGGSAERSSRPRLRRAPQAQRPGPPLPTRLASHRSPDLVRVYLARHADERAAIFKRYRRILPSRLTSCNGLLPADATLDAKSLSAIKMPTRRQKAGLHEEFLKPKARSQTKRAPRRDALSHAPN
jgi:hypothetical protein